MHRHDWHVRSAEQYRESFGAGDGGKYKTRVLYACGTCGKTRVSTLKGTWTQSDLAGTKP